MSFAVTNSGASTIQEIDSADDAAAEVESGAKPVSPIDELELKENSDMPGTYTREGYDGTYVLQDDGSLFYSGHSSLNNFAQPQIYKDGNWTVATSEETAQGNAALLGLEDMGNGVFADENNTYKAMEDGSLYSFHYEGAYVIGKSPENAVFDEGKFRDATEAEQEIMEEFSAELREELSVLNEDRILNI